MSVLYINLPTITNLRLIILMQIIFTGKFGEKNNPYNRDYYLINMRDIAVTCRKLLRKRRRVCTLWYSTA